MYNDHYGKWNADEHYIWYLQDEDFSLLQEEKVFDLLNKMFDVMIDEYEEEDIFYQKLFIYRNELIEKLNHLKCKNQVEKLQGNDR